MSAGEISWACYLIICVTIGSGFIGWWAGCLFSWVFEKLIGMKGARRGLK